MDSLEQQLQDLQQVQKNLINDIAEYEEELEAAEDEVNYWEQKRDDAEINLGSAETELETVEAEIEALEAEIQETIDSIDPDQNSLIFED